jgi:hypothetical protein
LLLQVLYTICSERLLMEQLSTRSTLPPIAGQEGSTVNTCPEG